MVTALPALESGGLGSGRAVTVRMRGAARNTRPFVSIFLTGSGGGGKRCASPSLRRKAPRRARKAAGSFWYPRLAQQLRHSDGLVVNIKVATDLFKEACRMAGKLDPHTT